MVLAVGLAMDATAAAWALSLSKASTSGRWTRIFWVATLFGVAQATMPAIGWWLGIAVSSWMQTGAQLLAALVLVAMGLKMLWDARNNDDGESSFSWRRVVVIAVATSIDAWAAGITLPILHAPLWLSVAIIGVVTWVLSGAAGLMARHMGQHHRHRLAVVGGVVLLALGIKFAVTAW
jgi:manganese efflux pump family protein